MDGNMGDNGQYGYSPFQHHHTFHHSTPNLLQYPVPVMIGGYMGDQKTRRFTPDQHVFLEGEFRADNKPTTAIKRGYASQLGVTLERINNWFQNRRAKKKQEDKKAREDGDNPRTDDDDTVDDLAGSLAQDEHSESRPSSSPVLGHVSPFSQAAARPSSSQVSTISDSHEPQRVFSMPIVSSSMPATPSTIAGPALSFPMHFPTNEPISLSYDMATTQSMLSNGSETAFNPSVDDLLSFGTTRADMQAPVTGSFVDSLTASPAESSVVFNTGMFASSAASISGSTPELLAGETPSVDGLSEPLDSLQGENAQDMGFPMAWGQSSRSASTTLLPSEMTPTVVLSESTDMPPPLSRRSSPAGLPESMDKNMDISSPESLPLQPPGFALNNVSSLAMRRKKQGPNHLAMGNIRQGLRTASYTAGLPLRSPRSPASPYPPGYRPPLRTGQASFRIEKNSRQSSMASPSVRHHIEATFAQQEQQLQTVTTPHNQFVFNTSYAMPSTPMTSSGTNPYLLDPSQPTFPLVSPTPPFTPGDTLGGFMYTNGDCQPPSNPVIMQHQRLMLTPQSAPPNQDGFPQSAPPTQTTFII